jgi:hypothetical protein
MTDAPLRAAAMAAYIPAPPAPTISTSVDKWGMRFLYPKHDQTSRRAHEMSADVKDERIGRAS